MMDLTTKPLLIFGGNYSNLQATLALQAWARDNHFSPEQIVCTGDIVAYCANPVETIDIIRDWLGDKGHCIQGNVEQSLAESAEDCGCGFTEGSTCDALSRSWYSYAEKKITIEQRQWFASLPQQLYFNYHDRKIQLVHGAPSNISRFMFASQNDADFSEEFMTIGNEVDIIIAGHSGIPFTKKIILADGQEKIWHNSGALGMPANDGTSRVWFSVLKMLEGEIGIHHHSLDYDASLAQQAMSEAGLTQGYELALINGLWPSMDVLPEFESSQRGVEIKI